MRLSELYVSVQGEGPNVGRPTTFIRFGGCNMKCAGWPCDTPYAVYASMYRSEWEQITVPDLIPRIGREFPRHLCLTGGEPLMQPVVEVRSLVFELLATNAYTIDIFTNGSYPFSNYGILDDTRVNIIQDWKLTGSGEHMTRRDIRTKNLDYLRKCDAVKLVCKDEEDLQEAAQLIFHWRNKKFRIYLGAAWGKLTEKDLVEFMRDHRWDNVYLNVQVHKYIWNAKQRGI